METRRSGENDRMVRLYKASMEGSIDTLNSLMEEDPLILSKISLNHFGETPLHISASLGHLSFTKQLVSRKPKLAEELDMLKRSPLHLASAEGHTETVQALVEANKDMCLVRDEDGKIPLHYAAIRGRRQAIEILIRVKPESVIEEKLNEGATVLHLCVRYNQLEALKVLVGSMGNIQNNEFLNSQDQKCGNTILHLAVMLKQIQTVKYLLSIPGVKAGAAYTVNQSGFRAIDLVEHLPKDLKSFQVQNILLEVHHHHHHAVEAATATAMTGVVEKKSSPPGISSAKASSSSSSSSSRWKKLKRFMKYERNDWVKERSNGLMVAATVIATMAFQIAVNPPGGVWDETKGGNTTEPNCTEKDKCLAGKAVLGYPDWSYRGYYLLVVYNSLAFLASLSVIVLLISGIPLEYKFCMWLLTIAMHLTLTFVALTFQQAVRLVTPDAVYKDTPLEFLVYTWIALLLGIVALGRALRFLFFIVTKLCKLVRKLFIAKRVRLGNQNTLQQVLFVLMIPPNA